MPPQQQFEAPPLWQIPGDAYAVAGFLFNMFPSATENIHRFQKISDLPNNSMRWFRDDFIEQLLSCMTSSMSIWTHSLNHEAAHLHRLEKSWNFPKEQRGFSTFFSAKIVNRIQKLIGKNGLSTVHQTLISSRMQAPLMALQRLRENQESRQFFPICWFYQEKKFLKQRAQHDHHDHHESSGWNSVISKKGDPESAERYLCFVCELRFVLVVPTVLNGFVAGIIPVAEKLFRRKKYVRKDTQTKGELLRVPDWAESSLACWTRCSAPLTKTFACSAFAATWLSYDSKTPAFIKSSYP